MSKIESHFEEFVELSKSHYQMAVDADYHLNIDDCISNLRLAMDCLSKAKEDLESYIMGCLKVKGLRCPYCKSEELEMKNGMYICKDCESVFDDEDLKRLALKHNITRLLDGTSAVQPLIICVNLVNSNPELFGLEFGDIPQITAAYTTKTTADKGPQVWFYIAGMDEPFPFEDIDTDDLVKVLAELFEKED